MATITAITNGSLLLHSNLTSATNLRRNNHRNLNFHPFKTLSLPSFNQSPILNLKPHHFKTITFSSLNPNSFNFPQNPPQKPPFLLATLFAISLSLASKIAQIISTQFTNLKTLISTPSPQQLETLHFLQQNVVCTVGPLFFAAIKDPPSGSLNTPLTVVAAGMAKWLDIYSGVLMVRVLLSWFPNIPWDRQPLSAIRDLCDPYLNLFRNIIPPVFDTLDVSPLLAFAVLGTLGSILHSSSGING